MSDHGTHRRDAGSRLPLRFRRRGATAAPDLFGGAPLESLPPRPAVRDGIDRDAAEILERVRDGLRALPGEPGLDIPVAFLRNILPGTKDACEPLDGFPVFAGVTRVADGSPVAGLYLGTGDEDGRLVLDAMSVTWIARLIAAAETARDALHEVMARGEDGIAS